MPADIPARPLVQVEQRGLTVWAEQPPATCPDCGAAWGVGRVQVGWTFCGCQPGGQGKPGGHRTYLCGACGEEFRAGHSEAADAG